MSCCVKFIKCLISGFAIAVLLISIGLITLGILILTTSLIKFDIPSSYFNFDPQEALKITGYVLLGGGVFMFLTSIAGIYGACKQKKCYLSFYWITLMIFFLFLLSILIAFPVILDPVYKQIKSSNCVYNAKDKYPNLMRLLSQSNEVYVNLSEQVYCKEYLIEEENQFNQELSACPCKITQPQIWTNKFGNDFLSNYTVDPVAGVEVVSSCPHFKEAAQEAGISDELFNNLKGFGNYLETTLKCTGICEGTPFYMFSNINRGIPSNFVSENGSGGCKQKLENVVDEYKSITLYILIAAFSLVTLNHFFLFYLCCQKKRNPDALNSYLELMGENN